MGRQGTSLPSDLQVIAIPAFENQTSVRGLEQRLTAAVMEEFIRRTRYRVVGRPEAGDAVLRGTVSNVSTVPVIFDPTTGRASAVAITVRLSIEFRDRRSQEVLFANPDYLFREQYEITSDLESFFEEQNPALDRLARDFAARLVSAILENF
ncbi:MAG: LPS assembly lipoprotein LptE [Terriglobia bacterium]